MLSLSTTQRSGGVGEAGFEPATSRLSAGCSNQAKLPAQSDSGTDLSIITVPVKFVYSSERSPLLIFLKLGSCITLSKFLESTISSNLSRVLERAVTGMLTSLPIP